YTAALLASVPQVDEGPAARRLVASAAGQAARSSSGSVVAKPALTATDGTPADGGSPLSDGDRLSRTVALPVLEVQDAHKTFVLPSGRRVEAVRGVSLRVEE